MQARDLNKDADIGKHLYGQNRYSEAIPYFERALGKDPKNDFLFNLLATCQYYCNNRRIALQSINQALTLNPNDAHHYATKSQILSKNVYQNESEAKEELSYINKALELDPKLFRGFLLKAELFFKLKKYKISKECIQLALAIQPEDGYSQAFLGKLLKFENDRDLSKKVTLQGLSQNPFESSLHSNLGWLELGNKNREKANQHFKEALQINPYFNEARQGLIECLKLDFVLYRKLAYIFYNLGKLKYFLLFRNLYFVLLYMCTYLAGQSKIPEIIIIILICSFLVIPFLVVFIDQMALYSMLNREVVLIPFERIRCIIFFYLLVISLFVIGCIYYLSFEDISTMAGIVMVPVIGHAVLILGKKERLFYVWLVPILILSILCARFVPYNNEFKQIFLMVGISCLTPFVILIPVGFFDFLNQKRFLRPTDFGEAYIK
jgi:tetratricopeptide (TPR) repeat protein